MFCLQPFSESEPELGSILHTGCYYAETVLTSPCGINFNRRYQFCMNQKPPLLSSLGMVWIERLDVPKSNKHRQQGVSLYIPSKTFWKPPSSTHCIPKCPWKTWGWCRTPATARRAPPPPPHPEGHGDPRAAVEVTKLSTPPEGTSGRRCRLQRQPRHRWGCALTFSALLNHNFTTLQDHKNKRTWERKERKEKYEQEH